MTSNQQNSNITNAPQEQTEPSLLAGHAQWIKGTAESAVGSVTNSEAWKQSGADDKKQGLESMQAAAVLRDANSQGYGRVEEIAGRAVGCEGMQKEGVASAKKSE